MSSIVPAGSRPAPGRWCASIRWSWCTVAGALHAAELLLVSGGGGVQVDGVLRPTLDAEDVEALIESGAVAGGMAAKLRAATAALRAGARGVRIGDLRLLEDPGAGTRVVARAPAPQPA